MVVYILARHGRLIKSALGNSGKRIISFGKYFHLYRNLWTGICILLMCSGVLAAEEISTHMADEMVVTGSCMPRSLEFVSQSMSIITKEEIAVLPVSSISDLLETVNGVDVRQRGTSGIQADVSIRGSSFEQTLILVDGFNVSDGQTGHHNMNLPVNLSDIERIEILKGPGARVYGHNAMAGVINIITKDPDRKNINGGVQFGEDDFYGVDANFSGKIKEFSNRLSISRRASSGYLPNEETDFEAHTLNYRGAIHKKTYGLQMGLGYTENDFGAYKFYSDAYPNQREDTKTLLAYGSGEFRLSEINVSPKVFWRRNEDEFKIEIGGNWFENQHQTNSYGFQISSSLDTHFGHTAFGAEMAKEDIESSNLGDHDRVRHGLFIEHKFFPLERLAIGLGSSAMSYSDWGWEFWPGADLNIQLTNFINAFASVSKSFRVPTYTELYYNTPANRGNPDLKPEEALTGEVGIRRMRKGFGTQASFFYRDTENIIDWTRRPGETVWQVQNVAKSRTRGVELGFDILPGILFNYLHQTSFQLSYTYLDSHYDSGELESKYVLDQLRHQFNGTVFVDWLNCLNQSVKFRYENRMNGNSLLVVDSRVTYQQGNFDLFVDASNLTDRSYVDNGFASAPGRCFFIGVRFNKDLF